jgi:hypothetical protein
MAKKKAASLVPRLTAAEQELLSHIQDRYQLETDSPGGNPVLRRLKDNEEIRPLLPIAIPSRRWNGADSLRPAKVATRSPILWCLKEAALVAQTVLRRLIPEAMRVAMREPETMQ